MRDEFRFLISSPTTKGLLVSVDRMDNVGTSPVPYRAIFLRRSHH